MIDRVTQIGLRQTHLLILVNSLQDSTDAEDFAELDEEAREAVLDLKMFLETVLNNPTAFPPTGELARSIRKATALAKGTSKPPSRKNKRKARQEKRQGWNKQRRKLRAANVAAYNEAVKRTEADREEAEAAWAEQAERLAAEPKFDVFAQDGSILMGSVPESMIRPVPVTEEASPPEIILPT